MLPLQSLGLGRSGSAPLLNHVLHVRHDVLLVERFLLEWMPGWKAVSARAIFRKEKGKVRWGAPSTTGG